VIELGLYLERVEARLNEHKHQIKWSMVGVKLAHGVCEKCQKPVVVQSSGIGYTTVTELLGTRCESDGARQSQFRSTDGSNTPQHGGT
jgi:hypothetical protein